MRIVHVIDTLDPRDGGPPQVCMRLAAAQAALGHDVSLLHSAPDADRVPHVRKTIDAVPGHERVRVLELARTDVRSFAGKARLGALAALGGAEWIHLHGIWHPILRAAAAWADEHDVPYGVRPAGMLTRYSLAQKRWKKRIAMRLGYRAMIDGARFIQALNRDEADEIVHFRPRQPVEIVPNGIFPEEVNPLPRRGTFRASHPSLGDRRFIVSVGRLHYVKGYDVLFRAFALLARERHDLDLVIAGPDGGQQASLEALLRELGVASRVHLVGPIYGPAKFAALVDADCFCLPSRHEAFSVAITEALAVGLPCVITPTAHFPEVADAGAGLVAPLDATALAKALNEVLGDEARRAAMGAKARALAHGYLWPEIARKLAELFGRYRA